MKLSSILSLALSNCAMIGILRCTLPENYTENPDNSGVHFCINNERVGNVTVVITQEISPEIGIIPTPVCTVTFDVDGGSPTVPSQKVNQGEKATRPTVTLSKSGYNFNGWYPSKTSSTEFDFTTAITANAVIYAKWTQVTCTVTFDGNEATTPANPTSKTIDQSAIMGTLPTSPINIGYVFGPILELGGQQLKEKVAYRVGV